MNVNQQVISAKIHAQIHRKKKQLIQDSVISEKPAAEKKQAKKLHGF